MSHHCSSSSSYSSFLLPSVSSTAFFTQWPSRPSVLYRPLSLLQPSVRSMALSPLYGPLNPSSGPLSPSVPSTGLCHLTAICPICIVLCPLFGPVSPLQSSISSMAFSSLHRPLPIYCPLSPLHPFSTLWPPRSTVLSMALFLLYSPLSPLCPSVPFLCPSVPFLCPSVPFQAL
jgi:hypothetical protein